MKNMKIGTAIWVCLLLSFFFGTSAKAESITSPDGQLKLNFSVNMQGEPVYELSYKGKEVIKPSKLGLELKNDPGLMNGFTLADIKTSAFDETWEPVWGEVKQIRNHYNEMAVTLNQKAQDRNLIICFRLYNDAAGIRRVVIGSKDPNPLVHGKGIRILREHGVEVTEHVLEKECDAENEVFFHYMQTKLPFVILKYAMTLDGKIATYTGASRWVTGEAARAHVHRMRNRYRAIMVGVGTVLADDPMLTCRLKGTENGANPVRIICDTALRTPLESQIVRTAKEVPTILATCNRQEAMHMPYIEAGCKILVTPEKDGHVDLSDLMRQLGQLGIDSVILEGGGTLNWSALQAGIVQKVQAYVAPKLFGGTEAKTPVEGQGFQTPADAVELTRTKITALGLDWLIEGYPVENRRNMGCLQES